MTDNSKPTGTPAAAPTANPQGRRKGLGLVAAAVAVAALAWGGYHWMVARNYQATDNAYVAGNVVQITPQIAGMVIAILAGLAAMFFQMPALGLAVSAMVALLSAGLILFETSRIVNGGETNYVLATVGLFVSLFNLFTSLLSLFGLGGND